MPSRPYKRFQQALRNQYTHPYRFGPQPTPTHKVALAQAVGRLRHARSLGPGKAVDMLTKSRYGAVRRQAASVILRAVKQKIYRTNRYVKGIRPFSTRRMLLRPRKGHSGPQYWTR